MSHPYSMEKKYRYYEPKQLMLLPPSIDDWLPENHMARFLGEIVDSLDIGSIKAPYEREYRGYPPYHPSLMLKILIYGYCTGVRSSRKIAQKCVEDVAFRYLAANQLPDFRTINNFRNRHIEAFSQLFLEVLMLCKEAGLANAGHIALDGTKVGANASKHKAMSYERMKAEEERLAKEIAAITAQAQATDIQEDQKLGKDKAGNELPDELQRREKRLARIQQAKAALEQRAAERQKESGKDGATGGDPPKPEDKEQYNFTDPQSRIMPSSENKKSFVQAYNAQIAVNENQIIIATSVNNQAADGPQLPGMMAKIRENAGFLPDDFTADAGYFSAKNVLFLWDVLQVRAFIPPDRQRHGHAFKAPEEEPGPDNLLSDRMRWLLATDIGRTTYAMRKALVEPVFGQIKSCMNFRQFLLRGEKQAAGEWQLACLCHNLRKLFRFQAARA